MGGALALVANKWSSSEGESGVGGTLVPAVTWPSAEFDARISPDGAWLSFISDRDNQSRIFMQAIEGADPVPVTVQGTVLSHLWSPDGRELAAVVRQGDDSFRHGRPGFLRRVTPCSAFGSIKRVEPSLSSPLDWKFDLYGRGPRPGPRTRCSASTSPPGSVDDITARWPNHPAFRSIDVSPDGARIAMDANLNGQSDLWVSRPGRLQPAAAHQRCRRLSGIRYGPLRTRLSSDPTAAGSWTCGSSRSPRSA